MLSSKENYAREPIPAGQVKTEGIGPILRICFLSRAKARAALLSPQLSPMKQPKKPGVPEL
jgi:hypothetical protein